jgi:hypothetical protein
MTRRIMSEVGRAHDPVAIFEVCRIIGGHHHPELRAALADKFADLLRTEGIAVDRAALRQICGLSL